MKYLLVSFFCFIGSVNLYSQVPNYSRITQQNIDRINATQRDREARKADLDRNTMDNISSVSSRNVITNHDCLNALNMGVKNATINELKLYNEMLKNGQLDPNEFSYINSNCVSQFNMAMDYLPSVSIRRNSAVRCLKKSCLI